MIQAFPISCWPLRITHQKIQPILHHYLWDSNINPSPISSRYIERRISHSKHQLPRLLATSYPLRWTMLLSLEVPPYCTQKTAPNSQNVRVLPPVAQTMLVSVALSFCPLASASTLPLPSTGPLTLHSYVKSSTSSAWPKPTSTMTLSLTQPVSKPKVHPIPPAQWLLNPCASTSQLTSTLIFAGCLPTTQLEQDPGQFLASQPNTFMLLRAYSSRWCQTISSYRNASPQLSTSKTSLISSYPVLPLDRLQLLKCRLLTIHKAYIQGTCVNHSTFTYPQERTAVIF